MVLAGVYGPSLISNINSSPPSSQPAPATGEKKETSDNMFIALLVVAGVIGVAFSLFWLGVMKRYSSQIIKISLGASVLLAVLATIAAFAAVLPTDCDGLSISLSETCKSLFQLQLLMIS